MKRSFIPSLCILSNLLAVTSAFAVPKTPNLEVTGGTVTISVPHLPGGQSSSCPPVIAQAQAFCQKNQVECEKTAAFLKALTSSQVKVSSYCHPAQDQCEGQGYVVRTLIIPDMSAYFCQ